MIRLFRIKHNTALESLKLENKGSEDSMSDIQLLCRAMLDDSDASIKLLRKYCHDTNRNNDMKNAKIIKALNQISGIQTRIKSQEVGSSQTDGLEIIDVCENGQIEMLKAFIECGADIDECEWGGPNGGNCRHRGLKRYYQSYSPLVMGCYSKQKEVVKLLLSRGCSLDITYETNKLNDDDRNYDALHAACRSKSNKEIIDMLMNEKKDWNYEYLTEDFDCDKDMIAYVESKRPID